MPMMEQQLVAPQCFLRAANPHTNMQPHLTSSLRGTPVRIQIGTPSGSLGTTANITEFVLVHRQSGDRADYPTQELDKETTSITTTSTELHTNKMIDVSQVACNISPKNFMGITEDSVHLNQPAGTSKMVIFDVAQESSVDLERGLLPFKHTEELLSLPSCGSNMADCVLPTEKTMLPVPPYGSMSDNGLPSEGFPCVSGMVENVLHEERPFSPSDFLQENTAPSSSQLQDLDVQPSFSDEVPPSLLDEIDQLLAETSENIPWYSTQQLDLNLFNHYEDQDVLDNVGQELGILDEVKAESHVHCNKDVSNLKMEKEMQVHCKREKRDSAVMENQAFCRGKLPTLPEPTTTTQRTRNQGDCVGPVRTQQTRRSSRKRVRSRMNYWDEESTTAEAEVTVNTELKYLMASTSSSSERTDKEDLRRLTGEEKYKRNREQNNAASKRCREKRKEKFKNMEAELVELERKNKALKDKVESLALLRDDFKKFVNKVLFERMTQK